jgi:hypothetical protein
MNSQSLTHLSLSLFVLSSIFLASKAKQWHCMLNLSPIPHIFFTFYFQFILVFGCVVYVVFMRYFVKNLGIYFVMDLLKIPDPTNSTNPKKPDPNRLIPAVFSHFYCSHGLEIIIPRLARGRVAERAETRLNQPVPSPSHP